MAPIIGQIKADTRYEEREWSRRETKRESERVIAREGGEEERVEE